MTLKPSSRSSIDPFIVMDVMARANAREAAGEGVIHMEVGQPSTPAPRLVREAAKRAIDGARLGYTEALGAPDLRERIARHYADAYGVSVSPERIAVTTGSSAGFILAFLALLDEGDTLALARPGYPCYRQIASALGLKPRLLAAGPDENWSPDAAAMASSGRAALVASPANPTGAMLDDGALAALAADCRASGAWLISDEIYHGLTYGRPATTALVHDDNAVVINSFSKYHSMTGWRVGWMVAPAGLMRRIERLQQNLFISPPAISQVAAIAAFDAGEELEANKAVYAANRELLLNELPRAGFDRFAPADGAFYLYADVSRFTQDSADFCGRMLDEIGVAATPGIDFDAEDGRRFVRFSYSGATAQMAEAASRLRAWRKP
ncbi:MAG: aminotransferase class I/II-fold pyridoxal phosphate-dependent enzyme [Hyphomicrobiales bacterium]|nr:aminotransferase class I/II-fold pyridoxal phosphate-dependent enzyme [Hyphomicrobiales bacterium]